LLANDESRAAWGTCGGTRPGVRGGARTLAPRGRKARLRVLLVRAADAALTALRSLPAFARDGRKRGG